MNITYPYTHNFGNMPSMYHVAGLGLGKTYPKLDHRHMLMNRESMAAHGYPSVDYGRNVYDNNLNRSYLSFHQQQPLVKGGNNNPYLSFHQQKALLQGGNNPYFSFHQQQPLVKGGNNNPYLSFHQQKALLQGGNNPYFSFHQQQGLVQGGMLSQFEPQEHDLHASNEADRVFFDELNEDLSRELAEDGASGVEVRVTLIRTEIIIRACYGVLRFVVENKAKGARYVDK
nr:40S ribosomal protein S3-3-like [Tanacetum cinerariifolium]